MRWLSDNSSYNYPIPGLSITVLSTQRCTVYTQDAYGGDIALGRECGDNKKKKFVCEFKCGESSIEDTIQSATDASANLGEAYLGCYDDEVRTWDGNQNLVKSFNDDNSPAK